ncbi:MAG: DUF1080 domain-containing protein [Planctomycetaceae bacterium]|nr:DUF1080 domain-containing protein [Planctomycetaceae bacterium]
MPLFNGRDFHGWRKPADDDPFTIEDGQLIIRDGWPRATRRYLTTESKFREYVLRVSIRYGTGYPQIFLSRNEGDGSFDGEYFSLSSMVPNDDEWHRMIVIKCDGGVAFMLDGIVKYNCTHRGQAKTGAIALKMYGFPSTAYIKELAIKPLSRD